MIDIHSHLAWGLDDGPSSPEESLAMLGAARDAGTTEIVATPHCSAMYPFDPALLCQRIQELAPLTGGCPKIHAGCEFQITVDNIDALMQNPSAYTINAGPYLLLEFPAFQIPRHSDGILRKLLGKDIIPVIAHPERNALLMRDIDCLEAWVERGCLVQVTALSINGGFGRSARLAVGRLLGRGLVHAVASDAHDGRHRTAVLSAAYQAVRAQFDTEAAELLFTENPAGIIHAGKVSGGRLILDTAPRKRWWRFKFLRSLLKYQAG